MKKLIALLIISALLSQGVYSQFKYNANMSLGYSKTPVGILEVGISHKHHSVFAQEIGTMSRRADLPLIIAALHYSYTVKSWQPYVGYSTKGFNYGINKYFKNTVISVGKAGSYMYASIGVSSKKYDTKKLFSTKDKILIGLQTISGVADAVNQAISQHHYLRGSQFSDPELSWNNKYKADGHTPRFPGSTTWAVATTDMFHLTRAVERACNVATIVIVATKHENWKVTLLRTLALMGWNRLVFSAAYSKMK